LAGLSIHFVAMASTMKWSRASTATQNLWRGIRKLSVCRGTRGALEFCALKKAACRATSHAFSSVLVAQKNCAVVSGSSTKAALKVVFWPLSTMGGTSSASTGSVTCTFLTPSERAPRSSLATAQTQPTVPVNPGPKLTRLVLGPVPANVA
jgi:hypothetical protein